MKRNLLLAAFAVASMAANAQQIHFPLDGSIYESVSKKTGSVSGVRTLPYQAGVSSKALRTDGYSNYVSMPLEYTSLGTSFSISMWIAPEAYPMMINDTGEATETSYATVAGNLDESNSSGFGIQLGTHGHVRFAMYQNSLVSVVSAKPLTPGQWHHVMATVDGTQNKPVMTLYVDGAQSATAEGARKGMGCDINIGTANFMLGKSAADSKVYDMMNLNGYSGLIDEVKVWNVVKTKDEVAAEYAAGNKQDPDMSIDWSLIDNILRPQFHGMPAHNWTNECHGMAYSNGKYHLFFQKNGDGPWMSRLNWGHISSSDLINWKEERAAIVPAVNSDGSETSYDYKGCWSGAVFTDASFNSGKPVAIYTAVDNQKARIAMAFADDDDLLTWTKQGVIIDGIPSGYGDDFRDPYFFTANGNKYIIVGTKTSAGLGTCVLYKFNGSSWVHQGEFFTASVSGYGGFWEMPNVTDLGNGKYLFTCTPTSTTNGTRTLYWIGTMGTDGKFSPDQTAPQSFEADGTSKDGYGLLSPTIYKDGDKFITLGIVPDKVSTVTNYNWGWAHNYSLPRELSLSTDGKSIVMKPISTIASYRQSGTVSEGRQIEMVGTFKYASGTAQGFKFFENSDKTKYAQLSVSGGQITLDLTNLDRSVFDAGYNGKYQSAMNFQNGEDVTIDAVLDGSIIDVFVSSPSVESKAFSVRLYPTDSAATGADAFGNSGYTANIYKIVPTKPTAIDEVVANTQHPTPNTQTRKCMINGKLCIVKGGQVYSLSGARLK